MSVLAFEMHHADHPVSVGAGQFAAAQKCPAHQDIDALPGGPAGNEQASHGQFQQFADAQARPSTTASTSSGMSRRCPTCARLAIVRITGGSGSTVSCVSWSLVVITRERPDNCVHK